MKLLFAAAIATLQSTSTYAQTRKVFVTSQLYDGNLGGVTGADMICQSLADSATPPVPGTFRAWISDGTSSPANSFDLSTVPYQLVDDDGTTIANNFADLIDGAIQNPIDKDENGNTISGGISGNFSVWTNTNTDGTASTNNCNNWSGSGIGQLGVQGITRASDSRWTFIPPTRPSGSISCDNLARLYCFQQVPTVS